MRDRATFASLRSARRVRRGPVTLAWVAAAGGETAAQEPPRIAFAITRKVGGAVVRNRMRRRLRAAACQLSPRLSPGAYLIGAGMDAASASYATLLASLEAAVGAAGGAPGSRDKTDRAG